MVKESSLIKTGCQNWSCEIGLSTQKWTLFIESGWSFGPKWTVSFRQNRKNRFMEICSKFAVITDEQTKSVDSEFCIILYFQLFKMVKTEQTCQTKFLFIQPDSFGQFSGHFNACFDGHLWPKRQFLIEISLSSIFKEITL